MQLHRSILHIFHLLTFDLQGQTSPLMVKTWPFFFFFFFRGTIEITQEPIEISSPNFICSFNGQFYTYFIFWPLTSKVKFTLWRSKLDFFFLFFLGNNWNISRTIKDIFTKFYMQLERSILHIFYFLTFDLQGQISPLKVKAWPFFSFFFRFGHYEFLDVFWDHS